MSIFVLSSLQNKNMIYNSTLILQEKQIDKQYIFLAGSMDTTLKYTWRQDVIQQLGDAFHFYDPTNDNHGQLNDLQMKDHIVWELSALKMSDIIILNFLPKSKSPISMIELGLYMSTNKLIVICPNEFYQKRYISVLCNQYKTPLFNNLNEAIKFIN